MGRSSSPLRTKTTDKPSWLWVQNDGRGSRSPEHPRGPQPPSACEGWGWGGQRGPCWWVRVGAAQPRPRCRGAMSALPVQLGCCSWARAAAPARRRTQRRELQVTPLGVRVWQRHKAVPRRLAHPAVPLTWRKRQKKTPSPRAGNARALCRAPLTAAATRLVSPVLN